MSATSPRARIAATLTTGTHTATPAVVPYMGIFLRDHWEAITNTPWGAYQYGPFDDRCAVLEALARATGSDWVPVGECAARSWRDEHEVRTQGADATLVNTRTGAATPIERPAVSGAQFQSSKLEPKVQTLADVEANVPVISAEQRDQAGSLDFMRYARSTLGGRLCLVASVAGPLWRTHNLFGFNTMMTNLVEAHELVQALVERLTDGEIERVRAYARAGIDCVWIEDCMTSRDLISRDHFQRFHAPYVARIVSAIHDGGMKAVYYFCGDPWDRLDDLVATGADALSFEESKKGFALDIDLLEKAVAGRAALLGNLDAVGMLRDASPSQLHREVKRQLEVGWRTGKFVASLGSPVTPETPASRVRLFTDLVRELSS